MKAALSPDSLAKQQRRRDLAAIHALASSLGLDVSDPSPESTYRTVLRVQGGKTSAAELDDLGRRRVLAYLRKQGSGKGSQEQYIRLLWRQLGEAGALRDPSEAGLAEFLRSRVGVHLVTSLDARRASKVIEALKAWKRRLQAKEGAAGG